MAILVLVNVRAMVTTKVNNATLNHVSGHKQQNRVAHLIQVIYLNHARTWTESQHARIMAILPMVHHVVPSYVRKLSSDLVGKQKRQKSFVNVKTALVPGRSHFISVQLVVQCHLSGRVINVPNNWRQRKTSSYLRPDLSSSSPRSCTRQKHRNVKQSNVLMIQTHGSKHLDVIVIQMASVTGRKQAGSIAKILNVNLIVYTHTSFLRQSNSKPQSSWNIPLKMIWILLHQRMLYI